MCGIWDLQHTIVKDFNDSQDPQHMQFCRENAFVAIYALFSDDKCPLFTRLGEGLAERGQCHLFFTVFFISGLPLGKFFQGLVDTTFPLCFVLHVFYLENIFQWFSKMAVRM